MKAFARAALSLLLGGCILPERAPLTRYEFEESHMGTRVAVKFYAASPEDAERGRKAAFAEMAAVDASMSDYKADSGLSRLNAAAGQGPRPVSRELFAVLSASLEHSRLTEGAFDVTVGPLVKLWRRARKERRLPPAEETAAARRLVGGHGLILDAANSTAALEKPGMSLDLGGIAKGTACDRALAALAALGIRSALVDTGGGLALGDPPPGEAGWKIGMIGDPERVLVLSNRGVATSGDTEQFVLIDGVRYSHIVDPATGLGLTRQEMATVIAPTGEAADALATAFCVMGADRALKLAAELKVQAWLQWVEARRRRRAETPGFSRFVE